MKLGLVVDKYSLTQGGSVTGLALQSLAHRAEIAGFSSIWVPDHFLNEGDPVGTGVTDREMLEAFTTLGFIAASTHTIKIGPLVTGVTYRNPGILVKQATTLDVLSGGRTYFSIGAAWFEEEHNAFGIPFPPIKKRFEMLEETVQIALQMWEDTGDYNLAQKFRGKYYDLARTLNVPQSHQRPHPPLMIGGNGEKKTLQLVAKYADACNFVGPLTYEDLKHKLNVLQEHCNQLNRSFENIEKTYYQYPFDVTDNKHIGKMSKEDAISHLLMLEELGIEMVMIDNVEMDFFDPDTFEFWATNIIPFI